MRRWKRKAQNLMAETSPQLAGRSLASNPHLCGFFRGPEERDRLLLPFVAEGLSRGEKVLHIVSQAERLQHLAKMRSFGIAVDTVLKSGQFELLDWDDTYLSDDHFDVARMPRLLESVIQRSRTEGYPLARLIGNMEWCLEEKRGVDSILEYESNLHDICLKYPDPVICAYDIKCYTADFMIDMLRVHRCALVCGMLNENPYFVPPAEYKRELGLRKPPTPRLQPA
jgi:hypothetical protein